ncbi:MAG TPA: DUF4266 domain-containing protein [bacterium]|nr:DUF4266 domain-containing protein [bacterium]
MKRTRILTGVIALAVLGAAVSGCTHVKAWQKERLTDPIMSFEDDAQEASRELHWIEAREGSTGGTGSAGGGCACN